MNRRLIIAPLFVPSSWHASSSMAIAKGDMRSAISSSDDGSSTGTTFLTGFFLEADIRSRHSCTTFLASFFSRKTLLLCDIPYSTFCPGFIVYSSTVVPPGLHRGATGIQPWHNRQLPGYYRGQPG